MKNIINIEEFTYFLKVNKNYIIKLWTSQEEVLQIFNKHSLPIIDKHVLIFNEFCNCFISTFEYEFSIEQCQKKMDFLKLLYDYEITSAEMVILIFLLKDSVEKVIDENDHLSNGIKKELNSLGVKVIKHLTEVYYEIQEDKTEHKSEHSNLLNEYKRAVDISSIVSKTNPKGIITYVNDKFCQISGYSRNELLGRPHNIVRHPAMNKETYKELWNTIKNKKTWHGTIKNMRKDSTEYIVDSTIIPILDIDGDIVEYIAVRYDITELENNKEQLQNINKLMKSKVDELHIMTSELEQEAAIDKLTGIYNRDKFEEYFSSAISSSYLNGTKLSLILVDVDYFKSINDTYGHQTGDIVLQEICTLITNNIKTRDIFARWGGEEFIILLPQTDLDGAYQFSQKLRKIIKSYNFTKVGKITASFGVGELCENESKLTLFEKIDRALYVAKNTGRDRVEKALLGCAS